MNQGAKANMSGSMFHEGVEIFLTKKGFKTQQPPGYEAFWAGGTRLNQADIHIPEKDIQIECKYQKVPGSVDQKIHSEIVNAHYNNPCNHYILLLGGEHWESPRGNNIYEGAKKVARDLSLSPLAPDTGAKKVSVMKETEFKEFFNE